MDLVNRRRGIIAAIAIASAAIMVPAVALAAGAAPGGAHPRIAAIPECKAANIEVWLGLNPDGAAAGTTFYPIEFTNNGFGTHTCWIAGSPAAFAVNSSLKKIGPAVKASTKGPKITLKPGQTANAQIGIVDAGIISGCGPTTAAGLEVTPPGQSAKQPILSFTFPACKNKTFMHTEMTQAGVGIP
jgi:Protein of unknown function (DUF4232)